MNSCLCLYGHGLQKLILRTYLWMWSEIQLKLSVWVWFFFFLNNKRYFTCIRCSVTGKYLNEYYIIVQNIIQPIKVDMPLYHSVLKGAGTPMNTAAITKRKQPKMGGSINKRWNLQTMYEYSTSLRLSKEILTQATVWVKLDTMPHETPGTKQETLYDSTHMRCLE